MGVADPPRTDRQEDIEWVAGYGATRLKVESKRAYLMRRKHGRRRDGSPPHPFVPTSHLVGGYTVVDATSDGRTQARSRDERSSSMPVTLGGQCDEMPCGATPEKKRSRWALALGLGDGPNAMRGAHPTESSST